MHQLKWRNCHCSLFNIVGISCLDAQQIGWIPLVSSPLKATTVVPLYFVYYYILTTHRNYFITTSFTDHIPWSQKLIQRSLLFVLWSIWSWKSISYARLTHRSITCINYLWWFRTIFITIWELQSLLLLSFYDLGINILIILWLFIASLAWIPQRIERISYSLNIVGISPLLS